MKTVTRKIIDVILLTILWSAVGCADQSVMQSRCSDGDYQACQLILNQQRQSQQIINNTIDNLQAIRGASQMQQPDPYNDQSISQWWLTR